MTAPSTRRDFLATSLKAWAALAAAGGATAAGVSLWPREEPPGTARVPKASMQNGVATGSLRAAPFVLLETASGVIAFSLVCTHASCVVQWAPDARQFRCPCHKGTFDATGKVLTGPPPAPLKRLEVRDAGDSWEVTG